MNARWLSPLSSGPIWFALGVVTAGFASIVLGWSLVAGQDDTAAQTLPLVVFSGGGFLLVCVGVVLLLRLVARRDAAARERHLDRLMSVLDVEEGAA